jgi:glycosyltransferase involved in cell wall biosynthesis
MDKIKILQESIERLDKLQSNIYVFVQDTKGNAKASIKYAYDIVRVLNENEYNASIIVEEKAYGGVSSWLPLSYEDTPVVSIEEGNLEVRPDDLIVIPELFAHVMEQIADMPCNKVVLCQSYDYIFETLKPGATWSSFGFNRAITTTFEQKQFINDLFKKTDVNVITPSISEVFTKSDKPQKPIIAIHTRDQRDTMKLIKSFYVKYPQYKWVTFRDMRNLTQEEFAMSLRESCLSVWVDDISGFGTFPLESMKSGVPVIGKVPNVKPEWLTEDNGIWTTDSNQILDLVAAVFRGWLEDRIPNEVYTEMEETVSKFTLDTFTNDVLSVFNTIREERKTQLEFTVDKFNELETEQND